MKQIMHRYRFSKFSRFINGLLFAMISYGLLAYSLTIFTEDSASQTEIMFPFGLAIISMLLGILSMLHNEEVPKEMI